MEDKNCSNDHDKDDLMLAYELIGASSITMVMLAAAELDLFEIIARGTTGPRAQVLSASEIASQIPTKNPEASKMVDRILAFLTCHSVLTCSGVVGEDGTVERMYGLAPVCKYFVKDENGGSLTPLLSMSKAFKDAWYHLKDAVLFEGVVPFQKVHGMPLFQYLGKEEKFNQPFHSHDLNATEVIMKAAIDRYKVFENLNVVVDLGGGIGTALKIIISKYPKIKGINFDLPHVIQNVSPIPGVEHVGGDIFGSIPKADAIFMKNILHLWKDEQCIAILKNCFDALPDNGKVIVLDMVRPEIPEPKAVLRGVYFLDIVMMINGGKERTEDEFKNLAKIAGFSGIKVMCLDYKHFLIEFYKNQ